MTWRPILGDQHRIDQATLIINHVNSFLNSHDSKFHDLMYGDIGIGVYYGYQFKQSKNEFFLNKSIACVEKAINDLTTLPVSNFAFGNGIMGNLWGIAHLIEIGLVDAKIDDLVDDNFIHHLLNYSIASIKIGNYDYLLGGLGIVLLLQHLDKDKYASNLAEITKLLSDQSQTESRSNSRYWYQSPVLAKSQNDLKIINFGIAHGVPSIICILNQIYNMGIARMQNKETVNSATSWLLSNQLNYKTEGSYFPFSLNSMGEYTATPLRWCYGDLGVAVSFYQAGVSLKQDDLRNFAIKLAINCAERSERLELPESHLCHGTAGVAHIFNRFYHYTGLQIFMDVALYWFDQTFKNFNVQLNSGFLCWKGTDNGWIEHEGILEGSAGIGLSLISAISDIEPKWDRCLLLS